MSNLDNEYRAQGVEVLKAKIEKALSGDPYLADFLHSIGKACDSTAAELRSGSLSEEFKHICKQVGP